MQIHRKRGHGVQLVHSGQFFWDDAGGGRHLLTSGQYHRSTYVNYAFYVVPFDSISLSITTNEDYLQTDK